MIKRTLYFGNPAYLGKNNKQLVIRLPEVEKNPDLPETMKRDAVTSIPIEDIGILIIDHQQVTITQGLMSALLDNNVAVVFCNDTHHPSGLLLPLDVHSIQQERFTAQVEAALPLKKQLWQQTVTVKIENQLSLLMSLSRDSGAMSSYAGRVKSGDADNCEGKAAQIYWSRLFPAELGFSRKRDGDPPNNLLNYGYAILRALTARCLVGSGLLPTLGIHHSNKYNSYCLADDIMEPYRPFVDRLVVDIVAAGEDFTELTTGLKKQLLGIPSLDVRIEGEKSPLMVAMQRTTASLAQCFEGKRRKVVYPLMKI